MGEADTRHELASLHQPDMRGPFSPSEIQRMSVLASVDMEYRFGKPKTYVNVLDLARLAILRSELGETRDEREAE